MYFRNYEMIVSKMTCSNCEKAVINHLSNINYIKKAEINLLFEKLYITIDKDYDIKNIINELKTINKTVSNIKEIKIVNNETRTLKLNCNNSDELFSILSSKIGIINIIVNNNENNKILKLKNNKKNSYIKLNEINEHNFNSSVEINYNPKVIKATEIKFALDSKNISYSLINDLNVLLHDINDINSVYKFKDFVILLISILLIITVNLFVSQVYFEEYLLSTYIYNPIINLRILVIFVLSLFIILKYGLKIYKSAFILFFKNNYSSGMDTLISLGSISALLIAVLTFFTNTFNKENYFNSYNSTYIISDNLGTSALVIAISCIGKIVEEKAKLHIRKQSAGLIYSEEIDFKNIEYSKIKIKNKKFKFLNEETIKINPCLFEKDDFMLLEKNQCLLFDCIVMDGEVDINEKINQGYEAITLKKKGDKIKSGSIVHDIKLSSNNSQNCIVAIENVLENSRFFNLTKTVIASMSKKLGCQHFVDKITKYFVPVIVLISMLTLISWILIKFTCDNKNYNSITWSFIIERSISILVVSCPCAFGLAIPTVTTIAISQALKNGILIKNLALLPEIRKTKAILLDKTGTLTETINKIDIMYEDINYPLSEIVEVLEAKMKHPIAQSLYNYCLNMNRIKLSNNKLKQIKILNNNLKEEENGTVNITIKDKINNSDSNLLIKNCKNSDKDLKLASKCNNVINNYVDDIVVKSNGISALISVLSDNIDKNNKDYNISIGNEKYTLDNKDTIIPEQAKQALDLIKNKKTSCVIVTANKLIIGIYEVDTFSNLRLESKETINYLDKNLDIDLYILSGDNKDTVESCGIALNINKNNIYGGKDPEEKLNIIKLIKSNKAKINSKVMMVGDGVNDSLSLTEADIGVSFNPNSKLNMISSEVVIVKEDISLIISLIKISKFTFYFIWINIFWAFSYNLIMIPITSGLFLPKDFIVISPQVSSFLMLLSSLLVILNSNMLRFINFNSYKKENSKLLTRSEKQLKLINKL